MRVGGQRKGEWARGGKGEQARGGRAGVCGRAHKYPCGDGVRAQAREGLGATQAARNRAGKWASTGVRRERVCAHKVSKSRRAHERAGTREGECGLSEGVCEGEAQRTSDAGTSWRDRVPGKSSVSAAGKAGYFLGKNGRFLTEGLINVPGRKTLIFGGMYVSRVTTQPTCMALGLPDVVEAALPNEQTTVLQLLSYILPPIFQCPLNLSPEAVANTLDPLDNGPSHNVMLLKVPIPPDSFRKQLSDFLKSNKGTYKSLCISWSSPEACQAGLWLIHYWEHVEHLRWLQGKWKKIHGWLQDCRSADANIAGAHIIYDKALANVEGLFYEQELYSLHGQHEPAFDIASCLLSQKWVNNWVLGGIIDTFSIRQQTFKPDSCPECYILPCYILSAIKGAYHSSKQGGGEFKIPKSSKPLKTWADGGGKAFFFIQNINQNHWVSVRVDIPAQRIQIGDSLKIFRGVCTALQPMISWLSHSLHQEFEIEFDLVCGEQQDGISCGLFAANTIAFHVFGDELLVHHKCELARVLCFNELVKLHLQMVQNPLAPRDKLSQIFEPGIEGQLESMSVNGPESGPGSNNLPGKAGLAQHTDVIDLTESSSESNFSRVSEDFEPPSEDFETDRCSDVVGGSDLEFGLDSTTPETLTLAIGIPGDLDIRKAHELQETEIKPSSRELTQSPSPNPAKSQVESAFESPRVLLNKRKRAQAEPDNLDDKEPRLGDKDNMSCDRPTKSWPHRKRPKTKSSVYAKQTLAALEEGGNINEAKWKKFVTTIHQLDPGSDPNPSNPLEVRHTKCGRFIKLEGPYLARNFKEHCMRDTCSHKKVGGRAPSLGAGMKLLSQFGFKKVTAPDIKSPILPNLPAFVISACRGLQDIDYPGIDQYLSRMGFAGGGSGSISNYARSMFHKEYRDLSITEKRKITAQAYQDQQWRIMHIDRTIYSTNCERLVQHEESDTSPPCKNCLSLCSNHGFRNAVRRKPKSIKNMKFTNHHFLNFPAALTLANTKGVAELLNGDTECAHIMIQPSKTPAARFVAKILSSPKSERGVFYGLVQALIVSEDKQRRGVGLQNFQYDPTYDEFCHMILSLSPSAYHTFRCYLPARTSTSFSVQRAREPKFPLTINSDVFELAKAYLKSVSYSGPLCLSCDDTKLLPSLQTYYDGQTKQWYLVGGTSGPIKIADNDELIKVLKSGNINKAPKVRLWVLQIPLPGIPPLAIAALPIASSVPASILAGYLCEILDGLFEAGINVVSYASDGSAVEQSIQSIIFGSMEDYINYHIAHPLTQAESASLESGLVPPNIGTGTHITFRLGFYRQKPLVMVQDSKHALKTCRNNLFSGARLLVLGNHIAHYSQIREIAFDNKSTLYHRDVEKMDRQDDRAAERLFCAATLGFVISNRPQYLGLMVYLFVLGDLCDAYQSRSMPHAERFKIAMRTRFFLETWQDFLNDAGYSVSNYFISREAHKILLTVADGLIQLIYVYRDYVSPACPLLPWLHSTEACEHMFAELRKLVKDFTYLDAVHSFPKLRIRLHASYSTSKPVNSREYAQVDPYQKKAHGYQHTCMDNNSLDLPMLCLFPTSAEMTRLTRVAHCEAAALGNVIGMQTYHPSEVPQDNPAVTSTDSNHSLPEPNENFKHPALDKAVSASEALHELIAITESCDFPTDDISNQRDNIIYAYSALQVERTMMIHNLPNNTAENYAQEQQRIANTLAASLPPRLIDIPDINEDLFNSTKPQPAFDYQLLTDSEPMDTDNGMPKPTENSEKSHLELARAFAQTLRDTESAQLSDRLNRWRGNVSGNSANAQQAAAKRADTYNATRAAALHRHGIPTHELWNELSHARIHPGQLLRADSYVWVMAEDSVWLAQVRCIYAKEGGRYGAHSHVPEIDNIGQTSYIGVQLFSQIPRLPRKFRSRHSTATQSSINMFRHVHVDEILMLIPQSGLMISGETELNNAFVEFTPSSNHLYEYQLLKKHTRAIQEAAKDIARERRNGGVLAQ
ncbi:hypothetical protein CTheo_5036 [Ceratobasidium theobromae]|uniref:Ubiquitin-like protease family profile domain-containing protein n=1 Tax=Ceratobasidium theobromae TaxID=1582974 RepID=A0A5N5QIR8_9AGAM|nr:hypothetical protein CTheo_5036 [Ceratobasidium theobromae]